LRDIPFFNQEFDQEWYCSFEAAIKGAYYANQIRDARAQGRIKVVPYDPILKVHTVWDLGVGSNLAIGFYQRVGNETHMIDYWQGTEKTASRRRLSSSNQSRIFTVSTSTTEYGYRTNKTLIETVTALSAYKGHATLTICK